MRIGGARGAHYGACMETSGIAALFDWQAWAQWFSELDRSFAFLLILPFVVAVVGLWSWLNETEHGDGEPPRDRGRDGE